MSDTPTTATAPRKGGRARHGVRTLELPLFGRIEADDEMRRRVEQRFQWPMIALSFVFLGLMLVELVVDPQGWQGWAVDAGFAIVWVAFVIEFVVKVMLAESRFEYVRKSWLDLLIIALPMLRPVRAARALANMSRTLRLRGAGTKLVRMLLPSIIGMKATERFLKRFRATVDHDKDPAEMTRGELEAEVRRLRELVGPPAREPEANPPEPVASPSASAGAVTDEGAA